MSFGLSQDHGAQQYSLNCGSWSSSSSRSECWAYSKHVSSSMRQYPFLRSRWMAIEITVLLFVCFSFCLTDPWFPNHFWNIIFPDIEFEIDSFFGPLHHGQNLQPLVWPAHGSLHGFSLASKNTLLSFLTEVWSSIGMLFRGFIQLRICSVLLNHYAFC